jgi:hypothetical protein
MNKTISRLWQKWQRFSALAMEFQAKVILGLLYFTLFLPVGLWFKATHDVLRVGKLKTNWVPWPYGKTDDELLKM